MLPSPTLQCVNDVRLVEASFVNPITYITSIVPTTRGGAKCLSTNKPMGIRKYSVKKMSPE